MKLRAVLVRQGQVKPQQQAKKFKAAIGERVETPCGVGTVLFHGKTDFADGEWVGVELDEPGEHVLGGEGGRERFVSCEVQRAICVSRLPVSNTRRWQARRRGCRQEILLDCCWLRALRASSLFAGVIACGGERVSQ